MSIRGSVLKLDWSKVIQWAEQAIAPDTATVQVRLRENFLYLLYEASVGVSEKQTVSRLSAALKQKPLLSYLPPETPPIDKIFLSGRTSGAKLPDWTVKLDYDPTSQPEKPAESKVHPSANPALVPKVSAIQDPKAEESTSSVLPNEEYKKPLSTRFRQWFHRTSVFFSSSHRATVKESTDSTLVPTTDVHSPSQLKSTSVTKAQVKPDAVLQQSSSPPTVHSVEDPKRYCYPKAKPTPSETISENLIMPAPSISKSNSSSASAARMRPKKTQPETVKIPEAIVKIEEIAETDPTENRGTISTEALARQGHPAAIATHLSEILGGLGVSVKVRRRNVPAHGDQTHSSVIPKQRLWVLCQSAYSPDPSLLAEPISQKLRELQLKNYQDACIVLQVEGEAKPDWMLRVDLTPTGKILKKWGKWGDAKALASLLNQKLSSQQLCCRATLKESTIHIFCHHYSSKKSKSVEIPDQSQVKGIIGPILNKLAPQGIQAATIYGVEETKNPTELDTPLWIDWLNLPAASNPSLQPTALTLAQQGNLDALKFLIDRLINPNLDFLLATGGIGVMLVRKGNLLHVMTEGSTCPSQSKMVPPIVQFLRTAQIQDLTGAKIYGRRSGQKSPLWRCGLSLKSTQPEPTNTQMEFAPPTAESDNLATRAGTLVFRPNLPPIHLDTDDQSHSQPDSGVSWGDTTDVTLRDRIESYSVWLQNRLMATGLFLTPEPMLVSHPAADNTESHIQKAGWAVVWASLGCLLMWQADLILAQLAQWQAMQPSIDSVAGDSLRATALNPVQSQGFPTALENIAQTYPTFNSSQLDEQFARYQAYIARHQQPPDILIIGSSRALRGVDPAVLEEELKNQGYGSFKVFNFGINGATLQVVDLILRRVLPPEQLPQLILIADGVRAVNSGRVDRTYESIAESNGYQQVAQGTFEIPTSELSGGEAEAAESQLGWLAGLVGKEDNRVISGSKHLLNSLSSSYSQRDRLKQTLQSIVNQQVIIASQATPDAEAAEVENGLSEKIPTLQSNGFLPMTVKFEPETYYQKHPKVSGYYDGDYQGFELVGGQTTTLNTLLQYVQPRGIDVVFVNMPLTQDYLDPVRWDYEQMFRSRMQQLETQANLIFIDLGLAWPSQYDYFSDPSHLNQYGAAAVSQRLAEDSRIPWPR
ncbi:MAG: hypothetical protein WBA13_08830 [Microcoleaceae cyanobacterium]